jgi:hypothetical protein
MSVVDTIPDSALPNLPRDRSDPAVAAALAAKHPAEILCLYLDMAGLVPAFHGAPPKDRFSMSAPLLWDKAFRSLLAYGVRWAGHVDGRDKPRP